MYDTKKFGIYLAAKRKALNLKQSDIAKKLNLTRQCISKYETGECFPDISIIISLAEIFEVSLDELIKSGLPP